jgi:hypothetical protein
VFAVRTRSSLQLDRDIALADDHAVCLVVVEIGAVNAIRSPRPRRPIQRDVHVVQKHVPGFHLHLLRSLQREERVSLGRLRKGDRVRGLLHIDAEPPRQVAFDVPEAVAPVDEEAGEYRQQQGRRSRQSTGAIPGSLNAYLLYLLTPPPFCSPAVGGQGGGVGYLLTRRILPIC